MGLLKGKHLAVWSESQKRMKSSKLVKMVQESKYLSGRKTVDIGVAFAESYFLRKLMIPIFVPLKLWLSYKSVL